MAAIYFYPFAAAGVTKLKFFNGKRRFQEL
jgi:hypothetical protein